MDKLTEFLVNPFLEEDIKNHGDVTVLIPGGFKPPHAGHTGLIEHYTKMPMVSKVIVFIGPISRKSDDGRIEITRSNSKQVFEIYKKVIQNSNKLEIKFIDSNNPYQVAFDWISGKIDPNVSGTFALGAGEDDAARISDFVTKSHKISKDGKPYSKPGVHVVDLGPGPRAMSSTEMRNSISNNDFASFKKFLPKKLGEDDSKEVFDILRGKNTTKSEIEKTTSSILDEYLLEFVKSLLLEGGNVFPEVNSKIPKDLLDANIKNALHQFGLDDIKYVKLGSFNKPILGDVDISVNSEDLGEIVGFDKGDKKEFFSKIESYFKKYNKPFKILLGLEQIHLLSPLVDEKGKQQIAIDSNGKSLNIPGMIQVDIMVGNMSWLEKYMSGSSDDSKYKAVYRNLLLTSIFSKIIIDKGSFKQKYQIGKHGLELVDFIEKNGKRQKINIKTITGKMDDVMEMLFGEGIKFENANSFEKLFSLLKSNKFKYPNLRADIIDEYKKTLKSQSHSDPMELKEIISEKMSIQRFSGANEMTDKEFINLMYKINPLIKNGTIDLSVSNDFYAIEKMDASPCHWGMLENKKFFLESANSGPVTINEAEKFNNPYTIHFYQALKFLNSYQPIQSKINAVYNKFGAFSIFSEMFPVLSHKGDEFGDFIFASTKYNKEKFGNKGAFVCFSSIPSDKFDGMMTILNDTKDQEWKIYINDQVRLMGQLQFDLSGIKSWISSPEKLQSSLKLLSSREKNNPEQNALKDLISNVKKQLQSELNRYANEINSFLGKESGRYPVEGVIVRVKLPDGNFFVKGTSEMFHHIAQTTWGTRKELGEIEKTMEGEFLKDVLGLSTSQPAALNRAIEEIKPTINGSGEEYLNALAYKLIQKLRVREITGEEAKKLADNVFKRSSENLNKIVGDWKNLQKSKKIDPDTIDKTNNNLNDMIEKFERLKSVIITNKYSGKEYLVYLARFLLKKRLETSD